MPRDEHEAPDHELAELRRGPLTELRAAVASNAVADRKDRVQLIVLDAPTYPPAPSDRTIK